MNIRKITYLNTFVLWGATSVGIVLLSKESLSPSPFVLRSSPVELANPCKRTVSNALLQAWFPIALHVMKVHQERTGEVFREEDWNRHIRDGACSRAQLMAIALGKVALVVNATHCVISDHVLHTAAWTAQAGNDRVSLGGLSRDLIEGFSDLTKARGAYCPLGVDRELVSESVERTVGERIEKIRAATGELPDFLVVDTAGMRIREMLNTPLLAPGDFSVAHEQGIPSEIVVSNGDGSRVRYEMCSFISIERSGESSEVLSEMRSLIERISLEDCDVISYDSAPLRAVATVRYGDQWFVLDDGCIWKVEIPEGVSHEAMGEMLLCNQPGRRALVFYRISDEICRGVPEHLPLVSGDASSSVRMDIILSKISDPAGISYWEKPAVEAICVLKKLFQSGASIATYMAAAGYISGLPSSSSMCSVLQLFLATAAVPICVSSIRSVLREIRRYRVIAARYYADHITISSDASHQMSIYA